MPDTMTLPGEHKTVQAGILEHAEAEGTLLEQLRHLHNDIYGNREFVERLRNRGKFFDSGIDLRHPQSKGRHKAFWKTSHEQHLGPS